MPSRAGLELPFPPSDHDLPLVFRDRSVANRLALLPLPPSATGQSLRAARSAGTERVVLDHVLVEATPIMFGSFQIPSSGSRLSFLEIVLYLASAPVDDPFGPDLRLERFGRRANVAQFRDSMTPWSCRHGRRSRRIRLTIELTASPSRTGIDHPR